jgi:hypothetical protein
MHPPAYDLALAEAMADELEDYLLSRELFWPLERHAPPGEPPYPMLSLGGLLLTLDELAALEGDLEAAASDRLRRLREKIDDLRTRWRASIEGKAAQELHSRLNLWRAYLADLEEGAKAIEAYPQEVRQRVMARRLEEEAAPAKSAESLRAMRELDARLRRRFNAGPFVWDRRLSRVYPASDFWFLYGTPRAAAGE